MSRSLWYLDRHDATIGKFRELAVTIGLFALQRGIVLGVGEEQPLRGALHHESEKKLAPAVTSCPCVSYGRACSS